MTLKISVSVNLYNDNRDHDVLGKRHCNSSMTYSIGASTSLQRVIVYLESWL